MNWAYESKRGTHGRYYTINGFHYDDNFPIEYALEYDKEFEYTYGRKTMTKKIGPQNCSQCRTQGYYRNVFVGYCSFCAKDVLDFTRGGDYGDGTAVLGISTHTLHAYPYMKGIKLYSIGCEKLGDEKQGPTQISDDDDNIIEYLSETHQYDKLDEYLAEKHKTTAEENLYA